METNYIARQPIFDTDLKTWGYELLFRSGAENYCNLSGDPKAMDTATLSVLGNSIISHMNDLCGKKKRLINFTKNLLLG